MPIAGYFDTIFATAGDKTPVPDGTQSSGTVSYEQGYTPPYSLAPTNPDAILVGRANFNQILNDITTAIQFVQQNGASNFITTTMNGGTPYSYNLGAVVMYNAGSGVQAWISTAATNTTIPGAMGATWSELGSTPINLYSGGTSTGSANAQVVATNQGNFTNTAGNILTWKAGYSVNAASEIDADSYGNVAIKVMTSTGLRDTSTGDIVVGGEYAAISDGTYLQLLNPTFPSVSVLESYLGFAQSAGTNGYVKLPGGIIFQWGTTSVGPNTSLAVTLPVTFPNAIWNAQESTQTYVAPDQASNVIQPTSTSQVTIFNLSSTTSTFSYFAIGN